MEKLPSGSECFVCGRDNPFGLKMFFYREAKGSCFSNVTIPEQYQSYPGVTHGGVVAAILDEASGRAINADPDLFMVTMELTVRYRRPVPIEQPLKVVGTLLKRRGKVATAKGELFDPDGNLLAESSGMFVDLPQEQQAQMLEGMEGWRVYPDEE
ncbi:MAG: PaaI family thioesterase [Chloroflexi bacterium]|nr:PaaI family thioesterase [Chloroflexota bacterium]